VFKKRYSECKSFAFAVFKTSSECADYKNINSETPLLVERGKRRKGKRQEFEVPAFIYLSIYLMVDLPLRVVMGYFASSHLRSRVKVSRPTAKCPIGWSAYKLLLMLSAS
jgi:hypothetical protein